MWGEFQRFMKKQAHTGVLAASGSSVSQGRHLIGIQVPLVHTLGVINHSHILKTRTILLYKCLMRWIFGDVVVPVLRAAEFDHKAMREASLGLMSSIPNGYEKR